MHFCPIQPVWSKLPWHWKVQVYHFGRQREESYWQWSWYERETEKWMILFVSMRCGHPSRKINDTFLSFFTKDTSKGTGQQRVAIEREGGHPEYENASLGIESCPDGPTSYNNKTGDRTHLVADVIRTEGGHQMTLMGNLPISRWVLRCIKKRRLRMWSWNRR